MAGVTEQSSDLVSGSLSSPNPVPDLHLEFCDLLCRIGLVSAGSVQSASITKFGAGGLGPGASASSARVPSPESLAPEKGAVAQLGERLICIQEVAGSIPTSSTSFETGPVAQVARAHP